MRNTIVFALLLILLTVPYRAQAVDEGQTHPKLNAAELNTNSSADIVPLTSGSGNVKAFACSCDNETTLLSSTVQIYVDGGSAQTLSLSNALLLEDNALNFYTGYIPLNVRFGTSIRVAMTRPQGTGKLRCSVSWALD